MTLGAERKDYFVAIPHSGNFRLRHIRIMYEKCPNELSCVFTDKRDDDKIFLISLILQAL
jgi:hypothetical protein